MHYLESQTFGVNIAYNLTLNMQICTEEQLIPETHVNRAICEGSAGQNTQWYTVDSPKEEAGVVLG